MYDISTVSLRLLFLPASRTATAHTIRKMRGDWRQESAETEPSRTGRAERGASGRTARALVARGGDGSGEGEIGLPVAVGSWFAGQAPCQLPPPPHQLSHDRFPDPLPYLCETPPPRSVKEKRDARKRKTRGAESIAPTDTTRPPHGRRSAQTKRNGSPRTPRRPLRRRGRGHSRAENGKNPRHEAGTCLSDGRLLGADGETPDASATACPPRRAWTATNDVFFIF